MKFAFWIEYLFPVFSFCALCAYERVVSWEAAIKKWCQRAPNVHQQTCTNWWAKTAHNEGFLARPALSLPCSCSLLAPHVRRPHSSYKRVVQGKCPLHFLNLNGVVCSNTLFSNTSALSSSLLFRGNSTGKILEHLVWSNTSGFQFLGSLARTDFLLALCGLPNMSFTIYEKDPQKNCTFAFSLECAAVQWARKSCRNFSAVRFLSLDYVVVGIGLEVFA